MSLGRLNNPLYDERGQFIVNQQPEANMFGSFYMNPTGAIGSGVSSGNVPAVANPLDNRPAGGGKGGGKGGGSPQPNYIASTPRPSMGKGGGKGGGAGGGPGGDDGGGGDGGGVEGGGSGGGDS